MDCPTCIYIEEGATINPLFVKHNNVVYVERLIYLILSPLPEKVKQNNCSIIIYVCMSMILPPGPSPHTQPGQEITLGCIRYDLTTTNEDVRASTK